MQRRMEAVRSDRPVPHSLGRQLAWYLSLIASTFGILVFASGALADGSRSGVTLETVTPNHGCPGETVTFTGKFGSTGTGTAMWKDTVVVPQNFKTSATFSTTTTATSYIPIFLVATHAEESGSVKLVTPSGKETNELEFKFP